MKKLSPITLKLFLLVNFPLFAQNSNHCETPNELDLNTISKCTIEKEKANANKVVLQIVSKKPRRRIIRKKKKVNTLSISSSELQKTPEVYEKNIEIKSYPIEHKNESKTILLHVVENVPKFKDCIHSKNNQIECFNREFSKHFAENFQPERVSENGITGKVFVQFIINTKGNIDEIKIKTNKKNKLLSAEIKRVLLKLPTLNPALHYGILVNVKHSLPINFTEE